MSIYYEIEDAKTGRSTRFTDKAKFLERLRRIKAAGLLERLDKTGNYADVNILEVDTTHTVGILGPVGFVWHPSQVEEAIREEAEQE